jgi:hypothetical protein
MALAVRRSLALTIAGLLLLAPALAVAAPPKPAYVTGSPTTGAVAKSSGAQSFTTGDLSGDCATASTLATICTKTNGVPFSYFATGTDAANLTGTLGCAGLPAFTGDVTNLACALTIGAHKVALSMQAQIAANTMLGNWTGSTADVAANAMPSCADTGGNHLNYVSGTGLTCGTSGGSSGTVTHTGALTSGQLVFGNGTADVAVGDLSGDVSTSGSGVTAIGANKVTTTAINNAAVTLAKIANAAANSRLLGSGASGSGSPYAEITLGTGLSMSGTTLNGISTGGTITTASITPPQGRLTLVTGVPVMTSDQTAKTHVFYTNYVGPNVPLYDGSNWTLYSLSADLDMALDTTNQPVENVYDLYVWNNSGTISIGAGPAWSNTATITVTIASPAVVTWTGHGLYEGAPVIFTTSGALPTGITAGTTYYVGRSPGTNTFNLSTSVANAATGTFVNTSGSQSGTHTGTNHTTGRGTGAGTTELQMLNGIWTNKNAITLTNGAGAGTSVAANKATYLGSVYMTANGQTTTQFTAAGASGGSNAFMALFNAYNQRPTSSRSIDNGSTYSYSGGARAMRGSVANRVSFLDGLGQSSISAVNSAGLTNFMQIWPNIDATNSVVGSFASAGGSGTTHPSITIVSPPVLGLHYVQGVETGSGTSQVIAVNTQQLLVTLMN